MVRTDLEKAASFPISSAATLQVSAFQASAPIVLALAECEEELRAEAIELFKQLATGELNDEQRFATGALLVEILFPNTDSKGAPGLDLVEDEAVASSIDPEAKDILARMDEEESFFADRLRELMEAKGLTQAELAAKVGIGQPAISMMLNRACRPQRKTVLRFAEVLGVRPEQLWPQRGGKEIPMNPQQPQTVYVRVYAENVHEPNPTNVSSWAHAYHIKQDCPALKSADTRNTLNHLVTLAISEAEAQARGWKRCSKC
jgi:transcriptional regulator with XRE-family HTH domain